MNSNLDYGSPGDIDVVRGNLYQTILFFIAR